MILGQMLKLNPRAVNWVSDPSWRAEYIGPSKYPGCVRVLVSHHHDAEDIWHIDGNSIRADFVEPA